MRLRSQARFILQNLRLSISRYGPYIRLINSNYCIKSKASCASVVSVKYVLKVVDSCRVFFENRI